MSLREDHDALYINFRQRMNSRDEWKELMSSIVSVSTEREINMIIQGIKNPLCECFQIKAKLNFIKNG